MTRIIIVGKSQEQVGRLSDAVKSAGFPVALATNNDEVRGLARGDASSLLISVVEPAAKGEWLADIAALRAQLQIPIIAIGPPEDDESSRTAALNAGADDCLSEPVHIGEMLARIRAITRRQAPEDAPKSAHANQGIDQDIDNQAHVQKTDEQRGSDLAHPPDWQSGALLNPLRRRGTAVALQMRAFFAGLTSKWQLGGK